MRCELCFHHCELSEGQTGLRGARACRDGEIVPLNYGKLTSLVLASIEKKPLRRFHPGSLILSAGSFGCNLRCPFFQNFEMVIVKIFGPTFIGDHIVWRKRLAGPISWCCFSPGRVFDKPGPVFTVKPPPGMEAEKGIAPPYPQQRPGILCPTPGQAAQSQR